MAITQYRLSQLEEIYEMSVKLAAHFPDPVNVQIGIYELLLNAVEHGNLGIDQQLKLQLMREQRWHEEMRRRMALPQHQGKEVYITLEETHERCCVTITDMGKGFDWRPYMKLGTRTHAELHGLGLLMVRHAGFDTIAFNAAGNEVNCCVGKH